MRPALRANRPIPDMNSLTDLSLLVQILAAGPKPDEPQPWHGKRKRRLDACVPSSRPRKKNRGCDIDPPSRRVLPPEILHAVFRSLPFLYVLTVIPLVCQSWKILANSPSQLKDTHLDLDFPRIQTEEDLLHLLRDKKFSLVNSICLPAVAFDHLNILSVLRNRFFNLEYLQLPAERRFALSAESLDLLFDAGGQPAAVEKQVTIDPGCREADSAIVDAAPPRSQKHHKAKVAKKLRGLSVYSLNLSSPLSAESTLSYLRQLRVEVVKRGEEYQFIEGIKVLSHLALLDVGGFGTIGDHFMGWRTAILKIDGAGVTWDTKEIQPFLRDAPLFDDTLLKAIGSNFRRLQALRLLQCAGVTATGISELSYRCPLLRDLQLHCCAGIDDKCLLRLAHNCSDLRTLQISLMTSLSSRTITRSCLERLNFLSLDLLDLPLSETPTRYDFYLSPINRTLFTADILIHLLELRPAQWQEQRLHANFTSEGARIKCLAKRYENVVYNNSASMQDYQTVLGKKCVDLNERQRSQKQRGSPVTLYDLQKYLFVCMLEEGKFELKNM